MSNFLPSVSFERQLVQYLKQSTPQTPLSQCSQQNSTKLLHYGFVSLQTANSINPLINQSVGRSFVGCSFVRSFFRSAICRQFVSSFVRLFVRSFGRSINQSLLQVLHLNMVIFGCKFPHPPPKNKNKHNLLTWASNSPTCT